MKKSLLNLDNITCPKCNKKENVVKNGKYKDTQKYKCKSCEIIFKEKNYKITNKREKELAMALLNLIKLNPTNISSDNSEILNLSKVLANNIDEKEFKDVSVKIKSVKWGSSSVQCNSPKIVICLVNNTIEIIRLPDYITKTEHKMNRGITTLMRKDANYKKDKEINLADTLDFDFT